MRRVERALDRIAVEEERLLRCARGEAHRSVGAAPAEGEAAAVGALHKGEIVPLLQEEGEGGETRIVAEAEAARAAAAQADAVEVRLDELQLAER